MSSDRNQRTPEETRALAEKILHYSRRYITQLAPLMLAPVYALRQVPVPEVETPLSTDGVRLFYSPERVIRDFREDRALPARQLIHVVSHCLLGHLPLRFGWEGGETEEAFDSAADIKAAQFAFSLSPGLSPTDASGLFAYSVPLGRILQQAEVDADCRGSLAGTAKRLGVCLDDHSIWSSPPRIRNPEYGKPAGEGQEDRTGAGDQKECGTEGEDACGVPGDPDQPPDWQEMLRQVIETAQNSPSWGRLGGALRQEYMPAEENGISYQDFLRRFAQPEERLLLDPDSFDARWYWLGLERYGDIPLLEPSEISEPPMPDDIVLALDTSGSCSGDTCRRFLRETLSILRDISAGASRFHILALQCDAKIQKELLLEDAGQLEQFLEDFAPSGFGGTDFRPVFQRVAELRKEGRLPRVRGLLYLSDGCGNFPEEAPDYPVTFLLLDQDYPYQQWIPDWVSTLILNENDFTLKEAQV